MGTNISNGKANAAVEIARRKQIFGALYGAGGGIALAAAAWGWDAWILNQSHAYFPWNMLGVSLMCCAAMGGLCGWLTARLQSGLLGILFWLAAAAGFAWLVVALPMKINPFFASLLDPQLGSFLQYPQSGFGYRVGLSLAWLAPFAFIAGAAQIPLTEPAAFSTSFFGKAAPILFSAFLMGMSGSFTDSLVNEPFRSAIVSLDASVEFVLEHQGGKETDPLLSRKMHAGALKEVKAYLEPNRLLFVGGYDETLGDFQVLVKSQDRWMECRLIYNQLISCALIAGE
ncbi:MAG: hypothetical protein LDL50_05785 [Chloroflexi bacterium]|nr:hypothetical protein [Chloroflexota bacterium]MCA2001567.1 hypothetical protein [Chloroflexota bacterium]